MEETELLESLARRALGWIDGHRDHFRLPDDVTARSHDINATLKPLGELARISVVLHRDSAPHTAENRIAADLIEFAWKEFGEGELFVRLLRDAPHTTYPLELYAPFTEAGLRHRGFESFAGCMATTRNWSAIEQEPTRALGVAQAQRCVGTPAGPDVEAVAQRTWLGGLPEPWTIELHAAYALTHGVFHLTGWGARRDRLPTRVTDYLALWLPAWLDSWLEEQHWDLCGELLAVDALLTGTEAPSEPWRRLAGAQEPDGAIPEHGRGDASRGDIFLDRYHSTLVGAFAATLATDRARTHPSTTARAR